MGRPTFAAARASALLGSALTLALVTGCGGGGEPPGASAGGTRADPGPPATLKQLAARTGCARPQVQTDAEELRQGVCKTGEGQYTVTTFSTDKGRDEWLAEAKKWGGAYLVGTRWVIAGNDPGMLRLFSEKVGGTVMSGGHEMPSGAEHGPAAPVGAGAPPG
ncbi:hypothetical protein Ssi03_71990 [Sphaerisporangium siamense]|uniref:Lipoprotein n=1 Tax=Sphaerisporangium siamense TaxID=795645 RepID=A0A7W7DD31_9ACTN|nr:hypothetical protein [Sphaerisporangium siamense]MBB4703188.1 hypothetical protein [Sphaerisporangium siamense]GII89209.1 hypothetical protein Ssi03_71990 [Sphaerisporangium siamense]